MRGYFARAVRGGLVALSIVGSANAQSLSPTRTRLLSPTYPSNAGAPVTLRAEVDGLGAGAPSRPFMTFYDGPTRLGVSRVTALGAGQDTIAASHHNCALTSGGGIKCWGLNDAGQLGDGTTTDRSRPVDVLGLSSGLASVTAGDNHTCALTSAGGVKCWGSAVGGIGDGTTAGRLTPVDVIGMTKNVVAVSSGGYHSCALTRWGGAKCWGSNFWGALGDGTEEDRLTPVNVAGLTSGVVAVTIGYGYTCALTRWGGVKCWGINSDGQIGDGTSPLPGPKLRPVDVVGLTSGVVAVTARNRHTCALTSSGGVKCWGYNEMGQLGNGQTISSNVPVDVTGLASGVVAIAAGGFHTCALTAAGGVKCWGMNNFGALGDGTTTNRSTPVNVAGLASGVVAVAAGYLHSCALTVAGDVKCWGFNRRGQLGDGTQTNRLTPVTTTGLTTLVRARAYYTTSPLARGLHVMRAFYSDDARHTGSSAGWGQAVQ